MTKEKAEHQLYAYLATLVEQRVKETHADLVAECARLQRQLTQADELANAKSIELEGVQRQLQDAEAVQLRLVQERDAARDEGVLLMRELCGVRDELDRANNEHDFHRADAGYWKGQCEKEMRLRLDERQQLMEEGGVDRFWAMMSRVMQDTNTVVQQAFNPVPSKDVA